jgi:hypothetical protein
MDDIEVVRKFAVYAVLGIALLSRTMNWPVLRLSCMVPEAEGGSVLSVVLAS